MPNKTPHFTQKVLSRFLLGGSVIAMLLGIFLIGIKAVNTSAYAWKPVQVTLPMNPGEKVSAKFVAEIDAAYEVTLEFNSVLPEDQLHKRLASTGDQPAIDGSWTISSMGQTVAKGSSRVLLYFSTGGRTALGQIKRRILSIPFHRGQGSFVQVIGRYRCKAGQTYEISFEQHAADPALRVTAPKLGIQLSRDFWRRHSSGMLAFAYSGLGLIVGSILLFVAWVGVIWANKRMSTS